MRVVANTLKVMEIVARHQPVSLTEVAERAALPMSTAHRALGALAESAWVHTEPGKRWVVTPRVQALFAPAGPALLAVAGDVCRRLRDQTGESVSLSTPDGDSVAIAHHWEGPSVLRVVQVEGTRAPLHVSATGKAYLAQLDADHRNRLLDHLVSGRGHTAARRRRELVHELEIVRTQGWAVVDGEWIDGVVQIGAAVVVHGVPVAGIGVGLPAQRLRPDVVQRFGPLVRDAAAEIAQLLHAHSTPHQETPR